MLRKGEPVAVLVVDDELDMLMLVRVVIGIANHGLHVVAEATDGLEALEFWSGLDGSTHPDVVVLDNRMPGPSGLEVARTILSKRPDQPIILFSAFLHDQARAEAAAVGIAACVTKEDVQLLPEVIWGLCDGVG